MRLKWFLNDKPSKHDLPANNLFLYFRKKTKLGSILRFTKCSPRNFWRKLSINPTVSPLDEYSESEDEIITPIPHMWLMSQLLGVCVY